MKKLSLAAASLIAVLIIVSIFITKDGSLVTPQGAGKVVINGRDFEAFALPPYVSKFVTPEYKSYFVEVEPGIKIHVMEVGEGMPVFLQHGNPTSGFLYRKVVAELPLDRMRVIMPTLVGLGFSSKVPASRHTLTNHIDWIQSVLEQLEVEGLIYSGQDWGGPIGMGALSRLPGRLRGAVLLNTGFNAPRQAMDLSRAHATVKTPVVGELLLEVAVSIFDQLHRTQGDPTSITTEISELYGRPVIESGNEKAPLALMRMVTDGPDHQSAEEMRNIEQYVGTLDVPAEIVWGMNDPILGKALSIMQASFPDAPVTRTEAGHFLQEEVAIEIASAITRVYSRLQGKGGFYPDP